MRTSSTSAPIARGYIEAFFNNLDYGVVDGLVEAYGIRAEVTFAGVVVLGYVLGSCPWGYWLVRIFRGEDIRKVGSGGDRRVERLPRLRPDARASR